MTTPLAGGGTATAAVGSPHHHQHHNTSASSTTPSPSPSSYSTTNTAGASSAYASAQQHHHVAAASIGSVPLLYTFYMFNRFGDCIFRRCWFRESPEEEGEVKLVAGLIYSMQALLKQLAPPPPPSSASSNNIGSSSSSSSVACYRTLATSHYKLHYHETITGYRMALATALHFSADEGQRLLQDIYRLCFVDTVVRDARYSHAEGVCIESPLFASTLQKLLVERRLLLPTQQQQQMQASLNSPTSM